MIPTITFTQEELTSTIIQPETLTEAATRFRQKGCLVLKALFTPDFVERLHDRFIEQYQTYLHEADHQHALNVGDKRYKLTVELCPPFNDPHLYAHPLVLPIVKQLLGESCILGGCTAVVALGGSQEQHIHRDHPWLFENVMDTLVPTYGIKMIIPLVDLNEEHGTTRMWPGSHVVFDDKALNISPVDPQIAVGSCMLMDYRVMHGGTLNRSERVRPILYNNYYRPWFRDYQNFKRQPTLQISRKAYTAIPPAYRTLFNWLEENSGGGNLYEA